MMGSQMNRRNVLKGLGLAGAGLAHWPAQAQANYPDKPIRIVVAFAPGSSTDIVARTLGNSLSVSLGQPVVIENRPGAGGNIATTQVARSAADGYTLLMHSVAYAVNPALYAKAGYEVNKELAAITMGAVSPNIVYVHPDVPVRQLSELVALSKREKLNYASSGNGTTTHLGAELLFRSLMKIDIQHVPFQPAAAAGAVAGGQVQVGSTSVPPVVQLIKSGRVRPLAVTSLKRSSALPDVPTVAELGFKGFEANTWFGLFAPAETPASILDRLNIEINKVLLYKTIADSFAVQSLDIVRLDRPTLTRYIDGEAQKWARVVREVGVKVD